MVLIREAMQEKVVMVIFGDPAADVGDPARILLFLPCPSRARKLSYLSQQRKEIETFHEIQ